MGEAVRGAREPMIGAIRLAWWRERLEDLDQGLPAPPEPRLRAVARDLIPLGISGSDVSACEPGWLAILDAPFPWSGAVIDAVAARGADLFWTAAKLVGGDGQALGEAGALWSTVDMARHCSDAETRWLLVEGARGRAARLHEHRFAPVARPLSNLAALAARDARRGEPFEAEGTPGRAVALFRHRLSGLLPRIA